MTLAIHQGGLCTSYPSAWRGPSIKVFELSRKSRRRDERSTHVGCVHARTLSAFPSRGDLRFESASNPKQDKRGVCSGQKTKCVFDNITVRSSPTSGHSASIRSLVNFRLGNLNRMGSGLAAQDLPAARRRDDPGLHVSGRHRGG